VSSLETDLLAVIHNQCIGSLYSHKRNRHGNSHILKVSINRASTDCQQSIYTASTDCQQSVNDFVCWIMYKPSAPLWYVPIFTILAFNLSKSDRNMVTAAVWKLTSTEREPFCGLHLVYSKGCATAFIDNRSIGSLYRQYCVCRYCYTTKWASTQRQQSVNRVSTECQRFWVLYLVKSKGSATADIHNDCIGSCSEQMWSRPGHSPTPKMSVNRASRNLCVAPCIVQGLCYGIYA